MKKKFKHFIIRIIKSSSGVLVFLLVIMTALFIWFLMTDFSDERSVIIVGIAAFSSIFSAVSAIATLKQAAEAQKVRENLERPNVISHFDCDNEQYVYFNVENRGNSPAIEIEIKFHPNIERNRDPSLQRSQKISKSIDFLLPGRSIRQLVASKSQFLSSENTTKYNVTTTWSSVNGELFSNKSALDLVYLSENVMTKSIQESLADISNYLKEISFQNDSLFKN